MSAANIFALIALAPMALATGAPAAAATVTVSLCDGTNTGRTIDIPVRQTPVSPGKDGDCHVKGCHAGNSRKRCHI